MEKNKPFVIAVKYLNKYHQIRYYLYVPDNEFEITTNKECFNIFTKNMNVKLIDIIEENEIITPNVEDLPKGEHLFNNNEWCRMQMNKLLKNIIDIHF